MRAIAFENTHIYEFDLDPKLCDQALLDFSATENQQWSVPSADSDSPSKAVFLGSDSGQHLPFYHKELFDMLHPCVDKVARQHFHHWQLNIVDSWLTQATTGEYSGWHIHKNSIFSGLVYFSEHSSGETEFLLEDPLFEQLRCVFNEQDLIPQQYLLRYRPKKAKLLLWRSSVMHRIGPYHGRQPRRTLAFNTWPTGQISSVHTARLSLAAHSVRDQIGDRQLNTDTNRGTIL